MPSIFLFYLLCAITDCPPPSIHDSPSNQPIFNLFRQSLPSAQEQLRSESRFTRSHSNSTENHFNSKEPPLAFIDLGDIQGRLLQTRGAKSIAAFEGIPYALPPIGNLRFRNPVPVKPWSGLLLANKTRKDCLQMDFGRMLQIRGVEDCLYLNVYTPEAVLNSASVSQSFAKTRPKLLPVIVFIHGGGWTSHSGTGYGPKYLLDKDVILVTLNYRLGVLGFLSTGDKTARGNFGLKDQAMALKWVVDHISNFGGDPKKITLMGESSGAGSVAHHIVSPHTSKLISIHGGIMLSGSSMNHWGIINDTISNTKLIAKRMFCPTRTSEALVECLRRKDPYMLVGQQVHLYTIPVFTRLLFGPVIESTKDNPDAFLIEAPEVTYSRPNGVKPIPVITGINRDEGGMFAANIYLVPFLFSTINNNRNRMIPYAMGYDRLPGVNVTETTKKISKFYFNDKKWSFHNRQQISNALGDRTITTGVYKFLRSHSQVAPTYGYFFNYMSNHTFLSYAGLKPRDWGISHGDELAFIFSMDQMYDDFTNPKELELSEFLVTVCANFASERQPLPGNIVSEDVTWSPILNPKYIELLEMNGRKRIIPFPYMERMKFWESLHLN